MSKENRTVKFWYSVGVLCVLQGSWALRLFHYPLGETMPIFRLEDDRLIIAQETDLELEQHIACMLG